MRAIKPASPTFFEKRMKNVRSRPQNANLKPIKPGEVRNPNGRPKGSRNKLGEEFIAAMYADFMENGVAAIETVRTEKPDQYLKVIASILPKELHVKDASLGDMSDEELIEILTALRSFGSAAGGEEAEGRGRKKDRKEEAVPSGRTH